MKTKLFFLITIFLFTGKIILAQNPTYTLKVDSMRLVSINSPDDAIEFGVYLTHTNAPTPFILSGEQLFFSFNPEILHGCPLNDTSNCVKYRIIGSQLPLPLQPRNPTVSTATSPSATILRLAINGFQGLGLNITGSTNLLVVRMRLTNLAGSFNNVGCSSRSLSGLNLAWRNPPIVTFATKFFAYVAGVPTDITTPSTHTIDSTCYPAPAHQILKLSVLPEGLYSPESNLLSRRDIVAVYLRNVSSPYGIVDSAKGVIDSITFTKKFIFNNAPSGTYYIQVNHFNSIETWSRSGGEIFTLGDTTIFNFTTADTQAYGNNLKLKGNKYCVFSGDIDQDGIVDGSDLMRIRTDAVNFVTGVRIPTDLNGDNIVDGSDLLIGDNNAFNYIIKITP